jgi:hypothetical protein
VKRRTSLNLTCFAVAVVAALLATPPVQAEISNSQRLPARAEPVSELHPVTGPRAWPVE